MKKDIHPQYYRVKVICSCGNVMEDVGSTSKIDLKTELCSACHPFYTGKQKFVDSRGQIEKFEKKRQQAKDIAEAKNAPKEEKQPRLFSGITMKEN